ncbi:MAG: Asp-tRNA(Asn)/Glu-tRNA(Gln) amidotransferase subunit GatB [Oscillospiraceae bacterium]|jgi:aspartyl-tRNA(Asn)/glutamyl-tRNA(Gln) amidotransferase subunit B|nr:Asp-tRNA(Asn)/Glu-tRNA(Gln) amidotransferase subunit GatB [Oscillospiraceae bacterium]
MKQYEVVMGLEVHVELATQSKLFCSCSAKFGAAANEHVCPACAGMPGMPAVLNKRAVELGIAAALVTNSEITPVMTFDKKNYFYPDLPTGYQITQINAPICRNGRLEIETGAGKKTITLKQIHIEEDAGKLVHDARTGTTLVDFNRTSVPLIEIVSNPDFRTAEEVVAYLEKLRSLLSFAGVSDCKMQEGSMRCDVNISVREAGSGVLGTRTEIKNMNSLKAIAAAIAFEAQRHIDALETGRETLVQETRRWDDALGESFSMREKENATDYRYFPNPEILPVRLDGAWIEQIRSALPEPAREKFLRMTGELGLPEVDSRIITGSKNLSDIFDRTLASYGNPREVVNWIIVELLAIAKGDNKGEDDVSVDCVKFAKLIELVDGKTINRSVGKKILQKILQDGVDPEAYVAENNLGLVSDTGLIDRAVQTVLSENEKSAAEVRGGNEKAVGFLMGKLMKSLGGKADPKLVNERLRYWLTGGGL